MSVITIPDRFICRITQNVMADPVSAEPCGHVFSNEAIRQWIGRAGEEQPRVCPFDGRDITDLTSLVDLREEIRSFVGTNPDLFEDRTVEDVLATAYAIFQTYMPRPITG